MHFLKKQFLIQIFLHTPFATMHIDCHVKYYYTIIYITILFLNVLKLSFSDPNVAISIDCGATIEGKDIDGRKWEMDTKYILSPGDSQPVKAQFQDPALLSDIPYMTARVSKSEMTYKFPIN